MLAALTFELPVLSSFLLIVAGILVGYALSYPYRGENESIQQQLGRLRNENEELHNALRQQQSALAMAQSPDTQAVEQLQQALRELADERERGSRYEMELATSQDQLTETTSQLAEMRGEVDELRAVKEQLSDNSSEVTIGRMEQTIKSLTERLYEAEEQVRISCQQLENERQQRADLDDSLRAKEAQLSNQPERERALGELRQQLAETQAALEQTTANLQRAGAERDEVVELRAQESEELTAIRFDRDQHRRAIETIERLRGTVDSDLETERARAADLEDKVAQSEFLLEQQRTSAERQDHHRVLAERARDEALESLAQERQNSLQLQTDVSRLQPEIDKLRDQREEVLVSLRSEQARARQLESDLAGKQNEGLLAEEHRESLRAVSSELTATQQQLETSNSRLQNLIEERDEAVTAKARIEEIVVEMRSELQKNREFIVETRRARDSRAEQLERELDAARQTVAELRPTVAELQAQLAQQEERMAAAAGEKEFEMTTLCTQLAEARTKQGEQQETVNELREELAARTERIAVLEQERNEALAQLRRPNFGGDYRDTAASEGRRVPTNLTASTRHDHRRGIIYTRPPAHQDDLKKISGIAEKLEQRLNDFGIYTYEQVMNWDGAIIEEFGRLLAFKDRISRDDWVGQARQLHEEHYSTRKLSA